MKHLLVYLSPVREMDNQSRGFLKAQIENSSELGVRSSDIVLITNFGLKIDGVEAQVIDDRWFSAYSPISTKVSAMVGAFEAGLIGRDLYWLHDLDAWQCTPIEEGEIGIIPGRLRVGPWDMAVCYFGRLKKWSGGSIFFRSEARDIFEATYERMYRKELIDEVALTEVAFDDEDIHNRIKRLNPTYNFVPFNIGTCWERAVKPLKVAHFNPFEGVRKARIPNLLKFYKGDNRLGVQFIPNRLISLFERHGIR